jgi:hypothetical protein
VVALIWIWNCGTSEDCRFTILYPYPEFPPPAVEVAAEELLLATAAAATGSNPDQMPSLGVQGFAKVDCATE